MWFSLQKLQSFHTKRKKHISNKMDSEEEKKEDKGEHINLKVKDQVRFCRCFVAAAVLVFKRALFFFFFFFFSDCFLENARVLLFEKSLPRSLLPSLLKRNTNLSLFLS